MVDYDLIIQSDPTGIEANVSYGTQSLWVLTNKTLSLPENTVVTIKFPNTVGEPVGTTERGWRFVKIEWNTTPITAERKVTVTMTSNITVKAYYEQQLYFPTRNPDRRKRKFEGKADEEVAKLRIQNLKTMMVEQQESTTAQQETMERLVGEYLNAQTLYGIEVHHYRNFSQELYGLTRLFKGVTLNKEASLKAQKWKSRGLSQTHLENIAKLFGITLTFP